MSVVNIAGIDIDKILIFTAIVIVTIIVALSARAFIQWLFGKRLETIRNSKLIARAVEYIVIFVGLYIAFGFWMGGNPLALAASLGLISIAIAFSSQQVIQNFIAGLLIALNRPMRLDDWVEISNSGLCSVQDITLSYTVLKNLDGRIIMMPNSAALSSSITNYTKSGHVQIPLRLDIPASADMERVKSIVHNVLDSIEEVHHTYADNETQPLIDLLSRLRKTPRKIERFPLDPRLLIVNVTPSIITLEVRVWIDDFRQRDIIKAKLMDALNKSLADIENPRKVDDKMLSVLRQMLEEMKERQTHLEDLISQREERGEEVRTR